MKFKAGDRVIWRDAMGGEWVGEITIISDMGYKVLFDDGDGPEYWYYQEVELRLETPEAK